ncbi:Nematode Specific Peptide family, group B [Caenorhabditis elegans]|uniref:Nematode Specific Peptide family, group B n=1 Tax=Caenorhabditis elegans TaxID=6239 RepID=Q9TYQ9_CAEEL|nr:Nematode Specific Peptide family, group B [Caenorhabditis elegans]CCD63378.1 Nematode Specific Peptide family, group B [Caenorhabditis elegans]|eukprot:NP_500886.1 Nematode Specific Peptide family, group B [Caenorhabditis elegans]
MFQKSLIVLALALFCISSSQVVYSPEVVASPYYYGAAPVAASAYPYAYAYGATAYPTAFYGWGSNKGQQARASAVPTQKLTNNQ